MNEIFNVAHSKDYYKGKSIEFAGEWASGVRYFNDEFLTNFIVYTERDAADNVTASALLACKKTHVSKRNTSIVDRTQNQPRLINDEKLGVVGIEPNDYWIFVSGSLHGVPGASAEVVDTYADAILKATDNNLGKTIYVKDPRGAYIVLGANRLQRIVIGDEVEELSKTKVDKIDGKGLSTEDFTTEEKQKLSTVEEGAQANVIENIVLNGVHLVPSDKTVSIDVRQDSYTLDKLSTPEGDYLASYVLKQNGVRLGATINVPKDKHVSSGSVKEVVANGYPYAGAVVGDKYIDLELNDASRTHIYIDATKLVDAYSGDKYITVNSAVKTINLDYNTLKSDLNKDIAIDVGQVTGLAVRLADLEDENKKVISIGKSGDPLHGAIILSDDFVVDRETKTVKVNALKFETSGLADQVHQTLLGSKNDNIENKETIWALKNAIIDLGHDFLSADDIGPGLKMDGDTLTLALKDESSLQIDKDGNLVLVWL